MDIKIRNAQAADMGKVLHLIQELATFEKEADAVEVTEADLIRDGFGPQKRFHCFVAESPEGLAGIALVYERYSTWKGPVLHLEDLIVTENMRGHGVGSLLLEKVVTYAHDLGMKRVSWEVLDWNEPAIAFYESKGANVMRDWDVVHLTENGIKNFISNI